MKKIIIGTIIALAALTALISLTKYTFVESAQLVFGSIFFIFLPGYALTEFMPKMVPLQRFVIGTLLSLSVFPILNFWMSFANLYLPTVAYALAILALCWLAYRHHCKEK